MYGCVAVCVTVVLTVWPVSRQSVVGVCVWVCCSVCDSGADCVACVPAVSGGCVCMGVLQCVGQCC